MIILEHHYNTQYSASYLPNRSIDYISAQYAYNH